MCASSSRLQLPMPGQGYYRYPVDEPSWSKHVRLRGVRGRGSRWGALTALSQGRGRRRNGAERMRAYEEESEEAIDLTQNDDDEVEEEMAEAGGDAAPSVPAPILSPLSSRIPVPLDLRVGHCSLQGGAGEPDSAQVPE